MWVISHSHSREENGKYGSEHILNVNTVIQHKERSNVENESNHNKHNKLCQPIEETWYYSILDCQLLGNLQLFSIFMEDNILVAEGANCTNVCHRLHNDIWRLFICLLGFWGWPCSKCHSYCAGCDEERNETESNQWSSPLENKSNN